MKPETVQLLFDCFMKEKKDRNYYDVVDGVPYNRRVVVQGADAGEHIGVDDDRLNELLYLNPENAEPFEIHYDELNHEQALLARAFGRQLSDMANEFEELNLSERRRSAANGDNTFQFQKRSLFVEPTSEKVEIPIICVGSPDKEFTVNWKTKDKTAKDGVHYFGTEGSILFRRGEKEKVITILLTGNRNEDVSFIIELLDSGDINIGLMNPITVNITDHKNLYSDEKNVVENIIDSRRFSIANVKSCLLHSSEVTANTFKTALMYMCSNANSVPQEFAYAFELLRIALPAARRETMLNIVCNHFRAAPDLEDLREYIVEDNQSSEEDDSEEESDSDESD